MALPKHSPQMPPPEGLMIAVKMKPKGTPSDSANNSNQNGDDQSGPKASMEEATRKGATRVCSQCEHWQQDGSCTRVDGVFEPDDPFGAHCGYFDPAEGDDEDAEESNEPPDSDESGPTPPENEPQ